MRILFCASEIFPFAKSGGLADVSQALPKALSRDTQMMCVMPLYGFMDATSLDAYGQTLELKLGGIEYHVQIFTTVRQGVQIYFIKAPMLSTTEHLYGDSAGAYSNNDLRFGIFCAAIVELAGILEVDICHLNDWHSALVALFVREKNLQIKTIFTIHNLAYQGIFEPDTLERLGIKRQYFHINGLEFYGKVNFLKAGIAYSDALTTVSPNYAKEILTPEFGCGLEGFLNLHREKITGILNGIDTDFFDPQNDSALTYPYSATNLKNKNKNKKELYARFGLGSTKLPLFVMISRLAHQKGFDLMLESLDAILTQKLQLLLLVDGQSEYLKSLEDFAKKYKNFTLLFGYDEALSHRVYASGDFLLMPSLFEPCGLNQMIAMRYGTVPLVHDVGGLHDSVHQGTTGAGGIVFKKPSKKALLLAFARALHLYADKPLLERINIANMQRDFSFAPGAQKYLKLYQKLLA